MGRVVDFSRAKKALVKESRKTSEMQALEDFSHEIIPLLGKATPTQLMYTMQLSLAFFADETDKERGLKYLNTLANKLYNDSLL